MMKLSKILLCLAFALVAVGCTKEATGVQRPPIVFRHQFVGAQAVGSLAKAPKAVELLSSTNAVAFRKLVSERFAKWLAAGVGKSDAAAVDGLSDLVNELVSADAAFELRQGAGSWEATLAIKTAATGRPGLEGKFKTVAASLGRTISLESAGDWLIAGVGSKGLVPLSETKSAIASSGRPWKLDAGTLVSLEADLPKLSAFFGWPDSPVRSGAITLTISPQGENLKTTAQVAFPETIAVGQGVWNAPTNLLRDPLVNFTAIRSLGAFLQPGSMFDSVIGRQMNQSQTYLWTLSQVPFQYYFAMASASPKAEMDRLGVAIPQAWNPILKAYNSGEFGWNSNRTQLQMKGGALLAPFVLATNDATGGWITGGFFPFVPNRQPAPKELMDEFQNRKDLVYYDWEISQERVGFWRVMGQIAPVFGRKVAGVDIREQRRLFSTTERFLDGIAPQLGNTVTEAKSAGPKEFSVTRKSHLGLSGFELVHLARWLADSPSSLTPLTISGGSPSVVPVPGVAPKPGHP